MKGLTENLWNPEWKVSDGHVHFGECGLTSLKMDVKQIEAHFKRYSLESLLVIPLDIDLHKWNLELINLVKRNPRFYGLVRYQFAEYFKDISRFLDLLRNPQIVGVKLHPTFDRLPISHAVFEEMLEAVNQRSLIALIHCGRWTDVSGFKHAFEVAERYPQIKVVIAHLGGNELDNSRGAIKLAKRFDNVYLGTSNCRLPLLLREAVDSVSDHRILFGTDVPWGSFYANLCTVLEAQIDDGSKQNILHNNLEELISCTV